MNEKLTLNDGTEIAGHLLESSGVLFLYMYEITFEEAFELLNNPENVKKIKAERYGATQTVRGYKELYTLSKENGLISAGIRK